MKKTLYGNCTQCKIKRGTHRAKGKAFFSLFNQMRNGFLLLNLFANKL